jgi:ABC-type multidrug transport system ATPase subunit
MLGRAAAVCHVVFPQAIISRTQASIEIDPDGRAWLTDLSGKQTTFVNGQPIARQELKAGDEVAFGPGGALQFRFVRALPADEPAPAASAVWRAPAATVRVGRAPDNDVVLNAPGVSRYHATLHYDDGAEPLLTDLNSANGTYVNGEPVREPRRLTPRDGVFLGGYLLRVNGREIQTCDLSASRIAAVGLGQRIGAKQILQDISLCFAPREFIGLMGPSGCGKSTLMDALNGLRPATSGSVFVNDLNLYENFDALRRSIGYVPQRDVLHDALTVESTLYYAAKMRLPPVTPAAELQAAVNEVIHAVGLQEHRKNPFAQLSGGQQKRLSLGLELITKPSFLFLDEPTSPLDPETTENMMLLFRRLADEGRIVVMVTHKFEKFHEMHHIVLLTKGGRLAFFGPPPAALDYFGCTEPADIYRRLATREPDEWSRAFQASPEFERYVGRRLQETPPPGESAPAGGGAERKFGLAQWATLTRRYLEIKLKDKRNTLLLLLQAPLVALILSLITGSAPNDAKTLFIAAIIAIWFGANNAIREIVAEAPIYRRERLANLKIPSYVFSKFAVLSGLGLLQCLLFVGILVALGRLRGPDFAPVTLILYATLLAGVSTGLFFSALVNSTEKGMSVLPLLLIPQLLLSGFLKPLDDLHVNLKTGKPAAAAEFRRYEADKDQPPPAPPALPKLPEPIAKYDGLGPAKYAAGLMVARWTVDALAHQVSLRDPEARDKLAAGMTVAGYRQVLEGKTEGQIKAAYRARVRLALAVLGLFITALLGLAMWALKRQDAL